MSKAEGYRQMIDDVVAGRHLLEDDEWQQLKDIVARIERKILANMPAETAKEAAT